MVALVACAAVLTPSGVAREARVATVAHVSDGDTIVLTGGARVRLLQIDAPELGSGECYGVRAARELRALLPVGTRVQLLADPRLDRVDRYGRLLRYVHRGTTNVNVALAFRGAATVWFYGGERGRHAGQLLYAARSARSARRGLWGACSSVWNPDAPAQTRRHGASRRCDRAYPTVCIPPPPPDLQCSDVRARNFVVRPPDPHNFDGNRDGRGCERP